jgi:hypothetical protein
VDGAKFSLHHARGWLILPLHPANPNALELMNEPTSLGAYLKRERERRGLALRTISESTKVSVALLEGLEADDISRWPGGIFRRAFVRSYAECVGLDADDVVRRFERQHQPPEPVEPGSHPFGAVLNTPDPASLASRDVPAASSPAASLPRRTRLIGTAADLTVAVVLAFGSAAAGSRLLWPVLLISAYYAVGVLLTGTSPMVALLADQPEPRPAQSPTQGPEAAAATRQAQAIERRVQPRRTNERPRQRRGAQTRATT